MLELKGIKPGWKPIVEAFFNSPKGQQLKAFLDERRKVATIYPPDPLRALKLIDLEQVKVVILGQDPYHGEGQANGLAFSVTEGQKLPPSLKNIFKEIARETGKAQETNGDLTRWAKQGVLLLNPVLTVEQGKAGSHVGKGWECLTDKLIEAVAKDGKPTVFMLWGKHAQAKKELIEKEAGAHLILESNHPSPLSATKGPVPFIGNNHFKKANEWLMEHHEAPIDW